MIKRLAIVAVAILVFAAAFALKESRRDGSESHSQQASPVVTETALPRLVDLGANKCIPCKKMAPILEEISEEYRGVLVVEFIDVWKNPTAGEVWGIRLIPTQVFIDATGEELFRHEGFMPKQAILDKWSELGVELRPAISGEES